MFSLVGKNAIITGGNKSLGLGITRAIAEQGAKVVVMASSDSVFEVAEALTSEGLAVYGVKVDLNKKEEIEASFAKAMEILEGKVDILINNAGIQRRNKCEEFTYEDWTDVINVNLNAVFTLCQLAGRVMLTQGKGKIINIASMLSFFGGQTVPAYAASKGGVAQLTKALSNEWASQGINVNAIAPGYMATDMNTALINDESRNTQILGRIPAGRWGKPEDMQGTAVFLASDASDYVCGAIIPVDGGYLVK
ncbi:MAG: SDR family oxidoreductase [Lachnospiraceae bacterium]